MKGDTTYGRVSTGALKRKHEAEEPRLRMVGITVISVVLLILFCLLFSLALTHHFSQDRPMHQMDALGIMVAPDQKPLTRFPSPNLQLDDGHAAFMALNELQLAKLNGYGWVEPANGIVHIPIQRAIDLVLSRGLTNAAKTDLPAPISR